MYEAVHVVEDGDTTPSRFASTAARYGYDGIVIRGELSADGAKAISDRYDIDVVRGTTIRALDRDETGREIARARSMTEILSVLTEDIDMHRFVAEQVRVDVLVPDTRIPHTTAKVARDHGIAIELDLGDVLRTTGDRRIAAIRELRRLIRIVDHYDVPYVCTANATSHLELRAPRELRALGSAIGEDETVIDRGLDRWGTIAEGSRRNQDDRFIEPGVRISDDEADAG